MEQNIVVQLSHGLHARPAAAFVKAASGFTSEIQLVKKGRSFNGKSIMGIMSAAIGKGEEVTLIANGQDEQEAIAALSRVLLEQDE